MAEHDANGAAGVNMDIYQKRGNQLLVVLARCFGDAKQVESPSNASRANRPPRC